MFLQSTDEDPMSTCLVPPLNNAMFYEYIFFNSTSPSDHKQLLAFAEVVFGDDQYINTMISL